jgi:hypothetical protein
MQQPSALASKKASMPTGGEARASKQSTPFSAPSSASHVPRCPACQAYLDVEEAAIWAAQTWHFDPPAGRYTLGHSDGEWEHHLVCHNDRCRRSGQAIEAEEAGEGAAIVDLLLQ